MQLRSLTRPSAVCHRARSVAIPLAMRRSMYTIAIVMYTVAIASTRLPHARQRARNDGLAAIGTRGHSRRPPSGRGTAQRSGRAAASCWMPNPRPIAISDSRSWAAACAGRRGRSDCLFSSWSTTISPAGTVQAVTGHLAGNGGDGRERSAAFSMGAILVVFASFAGFTADPAAVKFLVPLPPPWRWPRRRTRWAGLPLRWLPLPSRRGERRPRPVSLSTGDPRRTRATGPCC